MMRRTTATQTKGWRERKNFCFSFCLASVLGSVILLLIVEQLSISVIPASSYAHLNRVEDFSPDLDVDWLPILQYEKIREVRFFHKGLAQKFEVIFESGHVCSAKPIVPTGFFASKYPTIDFNKLSSSEKRSVRRTEWEFQGWSEIAGYHLDKILGFNRKPPIVGRMISSSVLFSSDPSWTGVFRRLLPSYQAPMALVPWMSRLNRGAPSIPIRNWLTFNTSRSLSQATRIEALDVSDKLVFDYMADDHDTQGVQNWRSDHAFKLLHWDTGLGWREGPYSHTGCLDILCGTKEWKGVKHHDPNPPNCQKICRFRNSTIERLKAFGDPSSSKDRLSVELRNSLKDDPLSPVFHWGLYRVSGTDKNGVKSEGRTVHFKPEVFYAGLDDKVSRLLKFVNGCIDQYGADQVLLTDVEEVFKETNVVDEHPEFHETE